jgi:hypothetical protein
MAKTDRLLLFAAATALIVLVSLHPIDVGFLSVAKHGVVF